MTSHRDVVDVPTADDRQVHVTSISARISRFSSSRRVSVISLSFLSRLLIRFGGVNTREFARGSACPLNNAWRPPSTLVLPSRPIGAVLSRQPRSTLCRSSRSVRSGSAYGYVSRRYRQTASPNLRCFLPTCRSVGVGTLPRRLQTTARRDSDHRPELRSSRTPASARSEQCCWPLDLRAGRLMTAICGVGDQRT